ncbi:MAG: hypothetical protein ACR2MY_02100 [Candidatus Dormibacteria bacterium]
MNPTVITNTSRPRTRIYQRRWNVEAAWSAHEDHQCLADTIELANVTGRSASLRSSTSAPTGRSSWRTRGS